MDAIEKYLLITGCTDVDLDRKMKIYIEKGFVPYGNPGITNTDSKNYIQIYFQAVVKYKN